MPEETTTITGQREADPDADREIDAYFEANPLSDADTPPESEGPARDEKGRFTSTAESSEPTEPEAQSADVVNSDDYQRALKALKRAKTPQNVIDSMKPEDVMSWGSGVHEMFAATDGYGETVKSLKSQLEALQKPADPTEGEPPDLDKNLQALVEYLGDEVAEPLKALLAARPPESNGQLEKLAEKIQAWDQREARRVLTEKHPEYGLDKDDVWAQVLESSGRDRNEYDSELQKLDAHRRLVLADKVNADARRMQAAENQTRDNGQPSAPSGGSPLGELSDERLVDALLDAQFKGDREGAERIKRIMKSRDSQRSTVTAEMLTQRIGVKPKQ